MGKDKRVAAIDADYFNKFTDEGKNSEFFMGVMNALDIAPVMHKYVYEKELLGNSAAKHLVEEQMIKLYTYDDFLEKDRQLYEEIFKHLYSIMNGKEFDSTYNIYEYTKTKESLGEIRTILMAFYMGIDMFFSDDSDSKEIVKNHLSSDEMPIQVLNILDTLIKLRDVDKGYKWQDIKGFAKKELSKKKYEHLNEVWHKEET